MLVISLNTSTGAMVYSGGGQITGDKNLTLTYQAANGDTFVETIVVDHDNSHVSIHESPKCSERRRKNCLRFRETIQTFRLVFRLYSMLPPHLNFRCPGSQQA